MLIPNTRRDSSTSQALPKTNNHGLKEWPLQSTPLVVAGSITLLALAVIAASPLYTRYQNGRTEIQNIHCDQGFSYYDHAALKRGASPTAKYCLGEMFRTGNGTKQSLAEARKWYKKAYEQGLNSARERLCDPAMYEHKYGNDEEYEKFQQLFREYNVGYGHICCPTTYPCDSQHWLDRVLRGLTSNCVPEIKQCPWETMREDKPFAKKDCSIFEAVCEPYGSDTRFCESL